MLERDAKRSALENAELFVLPTRSENFGVAIAEALVNGLPVVTTTAAPWSELVAQQCGWQVAPEASAIAEALRDAMRRPREELRAIGERGLSFASSRFDWDAIGAPMAQVYAWLVAGGSVPECVRMDEASPHARSPGVNVTIVMGPWLPVPPVRGGAMPKAWYGLAREFGRAGHRVAIFARKFPGQPDSENEGALSIVRTRGFAQGHSIVRDLAKDLLYATSVVRRLPSADILVTNDFWVPALAARSRRSVGATVICAARYPKGQYRLYDRAARIVAISSAVRAAIVRERPVLGSRTVVIPLPVDVDAFSAAALPKRSSSRTLLYVGRVHPEKGIELLLRAFAVVAPRFPDWRLRIVGPVGASDGGGGESFGGRLGALAGASNVELTGPVFEPAALAAEYRDADLFCYPSLADRGEAFGLAPLEAMAAGLAPVVSALECFRDFVRDGETGWTFEHRAAGAEQRLADVLARAMSDDATRHEMNARARSAAQRYTYASIARRYLDEFERLLATQPTAAP